MLLTAPIFYYKPVQEQTLIKHSEAAGTEVNASKAILSHSSLKHPPLLFFIPAGHFEVLVLN